MPEEKKGKKKKDGDSSSVPSKKKGTKKSKKIVVIGGGNEDNEPMNPALQEPDAMAILQKDMTAAPAVSSGRKTQLLVEARAERRKWVQRVPLPYTNPRDPNNLWSLEDRLFTVQSSMACKRLPTATKVLSELYGLESNTRTPEEVAQRVDALVRPFVSDHKILDEDDELLAEEISKDPSEVVQAYHDLWVTLLKPECALLVQGMRNFLANLHGAGMERISTALKSYLDATYESLKSHVAWKDRMDQNVRRSLESFVYGQAQQPLLDQLEWTGLFSITQDEWAERLAKLQFVQPTHLEIECLSDEGLEMDELLQAPIEAMLSIDQFHSPYEKLQRILAVYQGVNTALSAALSHNQATARKLPSADDVLPTIILTVLRAKPKRIFQNLQLVEVFAPQEYLRGEAGYAYTNLYGAVQFLQDLDMNKPDSLSISPEDFRKGLAECVSKAQERLSIVEGDDEDTEETKPISVDIKVRDVREARLRGEEVNLEWAMKWQREHGSSEEESDIKRDDYAHASLPEGFARSYNFLATRPEDVRMSDLPQLLSEYRILVHATEQLLGERAARQASEKRRKDSERNQLLDDSFLGLGDSSGVREPSLTS